LITSTVRTAEHKLLQELNLTARQPLRALITLYISFNQCRRIAKEVLVNRVGNTGSEQGSSVPSTDREAAHSWSWNYRNFKR